MKKLVTAVSILLSLGIFLGVYYEKEEKDSQIIKEIDFKNQNLEKKSESKINYKIYLPNEEFTNLDILEEEFENTTNKSKIIKEIIERIISNLQKNKMMLDNTKLENIFLKENEIYLNFSNWKEIDEKKNIYIIYSITNSLSEILGQKKIKFLIDGEEGKGIFKEYYEKNLNI